MSLVRRSPVVGLRAYGDARNDLRHDFWYSCAYCTITEMEATGIGFEIDHYEPVVSHPELELEYSNLYYSCQHCNNPKRHHPTAAARALGMRFFRADQDVADAHFELDQNSLKGKDREVGEYTVRMLRLNRVPLRTLRDLRRRLGHATQSILEGMRALKAVRVDELPPGVREKFLSARKETAALGRACRDAEDDLRKVFASEMVERDEEAENDRQKYLKGLKALTP